MHPDTHPLSRAKPRPVPPAPMFSDTAKVCVAVAFGTALGLSIALWAEAGWTEHNAARIEWESRK